MRILRPIVGSENLLMVGGEPETPGGSAVGAQLVSRHPGRRKALFAEQFAHQLDGRRPVATTLDEDLEDLALVVDSTPQIHVLACDPDDHLARRAGESHPHALPGRVEDWRAGLGRCRATSPVPSTSNAACGFPALRSPICFTSRLMGPILLGRLSACRVALDSC